MQNIENISINGTVYGVGNIHDKIGISFERFAELLDRDAYTPELSAAPGENTLEYTDTNGSLCAFRVGQSCIFPSESVSDGYGIAFLKAIVDGKAVWQDLADVVSKAENAVEIAEEANEYSRAAYTNSEEAVDTANVAKNAVATLEGLANTDTAQQTLAAQVTQIAQNTSDIGVLKERHQVLSEEEFEALEVVDQTRIYMLYEE